jgi:hypothetical protein
MGGIFSGSSGNSSSDLGSVPKELKNYIIKNPTEKNIGRGYFLKFTNGIKIPKGMYRSNVLREINNNSNNKSKYKYISVFQVPNKEPNNKEIKDYENSTFIYINDEKKYIKVLTKFKECKISGYNIVYTFNDDKEEYESDNIYILNKPKNNNKNK